MGRRYNLTKAEAAHISIGGGSSWEVMVRVATESAVLRCPSCGRTGWWEQAPGRRRAHVAAIPSRVGREEAGTDTRGGNKVHAAIGQEWRCSYCDETTREPVVGRVGKLSGNTMTGHGHLVADTNTTEDAYIDLCDAQLKRWRAERG